MLNQGSSDIYECGKGSDPHKPRRDREGRLPFKTQIPSICHEQQVPPPSQSLGSASTQHKIGKLKHKNECNQLKIQGGGVGKDYTKEKQKERRHRGYTQKQQLSPKGFIEKKNWEKKERRKKFTDAPSQKKVFHRKGLLITKTD